MTEQFIKISSFGYHTGDSTIEVDHRYDFDTCVKVDYVGERRISIQQDCISEELEEA